MCIKRKRVRANKSALNSKQRSDNPPGIAFRKCNSQGTDVQRSVEAHKSPARVHSINFEGSTSKQTEQTPPDVNQKKADALPRTKLLTKPKDPPRMPEKEQTPLANGDKEKENANLEEEVFENQVIEPKSKDEPVMKSCCASDDSLCEFRNTVPDYEAENTGKSSEEKSGKNAAKSRKVATAREGT